MSANTIPVTCSHPHALPEGGLPWWLARHVRNASDHRGALTVRVFDDSRTQADVLRESGRHSPALAERLIRCYALDTRPAVIDDWRFPLLRQAETVEHYWQRAAQELLLAGATRVCVGAEQWVRGDLELGLAPQRMTFHPDADAELRHALRLSDTDDAPVVFSVPGGYGFLYRGERLMRSRTLSGILVAAHQFVASVLDRPELRQVMRQEYWRLLGVTPLNVTDPT